MGAQTDVDECMRSVLVDWMYLIHWTLRLNPSTMFTAVNTLDRFLSAVVISRHRLAVTGMACMILASKYHDMYPAKIDDLVSVSGGSMSRKELVEMERFVYSSVGFVLSPTTPLDFVGIFLMAAGCGAREKILTSFIMDLSLTEYRLVGYKMSLIAASSVYIARKMTDAAPLWVCTFFL
jgi:transcription initiation factor TFIIIB Brf1 subunit/transcription initiation factor TFIIB